MFKNLTVASILRCSIYPTHEHGTTQKYAIGTRLELADGRVFRYSKAGTGGVQSEWGAANLQQAYSSAALPTQVGNAGKAGQNKITVTILATAGVAGDGVLAVNELAGGYCHVRNGNSEHPESFMILSHAAKTSGAGALTLTLDQNLHDVATASDDYHEVFANPYRFLQGSSSGEGASFLGIPAITCAVNHYFWLQTRGPCWITSNGDTGKIAGGREVYFAADGSCRTLGATVETLLPLQRAGFCIDANTVGSANSPLVMLQLE